MSDTAKSQWLCASEVPLCNVNTSFVYLKPGAVSDATIQLCEQVLRDNRIRVLRDGTITSDEILKRNIIDNVMYPYSRYAVERAGAMLKTKMREEQHAMFQETFGIALNSACDRGFVYNCDEAIKKLRTTSKDLRDWFISAATLTLTGGVCVAQYSPEIFIINGDYKYIWEQYHERDRCIHYFVIEWDEKLAEWNGVIEDVIGDADPEKARAGTLRNTIHREWKEYGLNEDPIALTNAVHMSLSPLEALHERLVWLGIDFDSDPYGEAIRAICGGRGVELVKQWMKNLRISINKEPYRPVWDVVRGFSSSTLMEMIYQNLQNDDGFRKHRSNVHATDLKSRRVSTTEPPDSRQVYSDMAFRDAMRHLDITDWRRIADVLGRPKTATLLPDVTSCESVEQGLITDSPMLAMLFAFGNYRDVLQGVLVSQRVRVDGQYTFKFYRDSKWNIVSIDDAIPLIDGKFLFVKSADWWPHLYAKAYAKFYGSYDAVNTINPAEMMHDFTGMPVHSVFFRPDCIGASRIDPRPVEFWLELGRQMEDGDVIVTTTTPKSLPTDRLGLKGAQTYWVASVVHTIDNEIFLHLRTPHDVQYTGRYHPNDVVWSAGARAQCPNLDVKGHLYVPLSVAIEFFIGVQVCFIRGFTELATFASQWTPSGGGNPALTSWRNNTMFVLENRQREPVMVYAVVSQPDQRNNIIESNDRRLSYRHTAVQMAYPRPSVVNPIETKLLTLNAINICNRGVYLEQRDVCGQGIIPGNSIGYIVPSTLTKRTEGAHDNNTYSLAVYVPEWISRHVKVRPFALDVDASAKVQFNLTTNHRVTLSLNAAAATEVHILVRQELPIPPGAETDILTTCHVNVVLYDESYFVIGGSPEVMNCRDSSCAAKLPFAGKYTCVVSCVKADGVVPCNARAYTPKGNQIQLTLDKEEEFTPKFTREEEVEEI